MIVDETATIQRDLTVNRHCLVSAAGITTLASETKITGASSANQRNQQSCGWFDCILWWAVGTRQFDWWSEAHIDDLTVRRNLVVNATGFHHCSDLSVTGNVTTHLGVTAVSPLVQHLTSLEQLKLLASSIGGPETH